MPAACRRCPITVPSHYETCNSPEDCCLTSHIQTSLMKIIAARIIATIKFSTLSGTVLIAMLTAAQAAKPARYLTDFATATAIVETSALSCLAIRIYLADSSSQQARGLMRIEQLDEYEGMLFRYPEPVVITMWMKNTYISLDMVFLRQDGRVATITPHTVPMSTARISSVESVTMVLELNAGFAAEKSFEIGDRLLTVD